MEISTVQQIEEGTFAVEDIIKHIDLDYETVETAFEKEGFLIMPINPGTDLYTQYGARTSIIYEAL